MFPGTHARTTPDKPAAVLAGSGQALTYRELAQNSARLARYLHGLGVRRGDTLALLSDNQLQAFEVYWAAIRSGCYLTAVNHNRAPGEVTYIVSDSGARAQVDDPGDPYVALFVPYFGFSAGTIYLSPAPVCHAAPLRFSATIQAIGGTVVMMERFDAEDALAAIAAFGITHLQCVPTMFVRMLKLPGAVRTTTRCRRPPPGTRHPDRQARQAPPDRPAGGAGAAGPGCAGRIHRAAGGWPRPPRPMSWETITLRWISLVPSPTIISGASRKYRSTSNSVEYP